ncbi:MAG: hypothetical protein V2I67_09160 [Thermoanaerobaculales bacterium]|nr:hypothetical protein [Thermoanaerobaculales bacterium]
MTRHSATCFVSVRATAAAAALWPLAVGAAEGDGEPHAATDEVHADDGHEGWIHGVAFEVMP